MLRIDGYIRVSRVGYRGGERFISPSLQREQILAWASLHGAQLLEVWEELDESGARAKRPLLESAVERIERGDSDGLVVAKVDRFARSLVDGLLTIQRIEQAGGKFFSVLDGLDLRTDTGRLVLRIMLSMAEWELERVRAQWAAAKARAVQRGAYTSAFVPPGYRKTRAGRLRLDPQVAPVVAEAFRRRAAGESMQSIGRFLEANGVRTGKGNPCWSATSATRVLSMRAYLGVVHYGTHVNEHAHPALIDAATWQAAQRPRCPKPLRHRSNTLLIGLVRCAACGMTMSPTRRLQGGREVHYFACRRFFAMGACPEPAYIADFRLDPCVESIALGLLGRRRRPPLADVRRAEERTAAAQTALASYRDSDRVLRALGERAFAEGLAARVERLHVAQLELAAARDRLAAHELPPVADVRSRWPSMSVTERRDVIARVIDVVFVKRSGTLADRVMVCPAGTAPANLPRPGDRRAKLRRYEARRRWVQPSAGH
jgi:site-specific DNA recombinase